MTISEKLCPFCGQDNQCKPKANASCWCKNVEIPASLIALVPQHLLNSACICAMCVDAYKANSERFVSGLE